jgi:hypothetical protein
MNDDLGDAIRGALYDGMKTLRTLTRHLGVEDPHWMNAKLSLMTQRGEVDWPYCGVGHNHDGYCRVNLT